VIASEPPLHAQTRCVVRHRLCVLELVEHVAVEDSNVSLLCLPDEYRGIFDVFEDHQLSVQVALGVGVVKPHGFQRLSDTLAR